MSSPSPSSPSSHPDLNLLTMGNCASRQSTTKGRMSVHRRGTVKIIHSDGKLQELKEPIKAGCVISSNPSCFLCCSEHMYVDCLLPQVPHEEDLQLGQLYFLMPLAQSHTPISLPDLCTLAIKASVVLPLPAPYVGRVALSSHKNAVGFPGIPQGCLQITGSFNSAGSKAKAGYQSK